MGPLLKIQSVLIVSACLVLPSLSFAAENPSVVSKLPAVAKYEDLVKAIRATRHASRARIEQAARQEKVREAWETGKLIDEHILQHKERANYGEQVIVRLAKDLDTSETELRYMIQFARTYPIHLPADELSWGHYQSLLALNDPEERKAVAEQAAKEKWTREQIREEVKQRKAAKAQKAEPSQEIKLNAAPGKIGTYRVVVAVDGPYKKELALDLGFSNYYQPPNLGAFKPGEIVEISPLSAGEGKVREVRVSSRTAQDLYTYPAYVRHVVDGDTFYALIDLGFGFTTTQKLRLRGLDAPELVSAEGKQAKNLLQSVIASTAKPASPAGGQSQTILIRATKSDKYDRYLADVWVRPWPIDHSPKNAKDTAMDHGPSTMDYVYINQKLLDSDLAVVMNE